MILLRQTPGSPENAHTVGQALPIAMVVENEAQFSEMERVKEPAGVVVTPTTISASLSSGVAATATGGESNESRLTFSHPWTTSAKYTGSWNGSVLADPCIW